MAKTLLDRLRSAHQSVAELVLIDPVYLPIFERLEAELLAAQSSESAIERARAVAARQRATG
ncbi:hypothetical protein PVW46_11025 [Mameliella sp. AT18]|uniref:hypothetical protein n=1 Tax=Mameliella sp. AT18 TaxID=3028385 RepID=UPI00237BC031|nr:hypothetical protein [Mameliella sp. AT18]MDD9730441.1 hypothetical protein [Mameliella sp. AT18]